MNFRPYFNVENANIAYIVLSAIVWVISIALWIMFSFWYGFAFMAISQIAFYAIIYMLYDINIIDVILIWRACGRNSANQYVYTRILTH